MEDVGRVRKEFSGLRIEVVREALRELRYSGGSIHDSFPSEYDEWRKAGTHVVAKETKGGVSLHIHRDPAFHIGKARTKGRDLEVEVKLIQKQMKHCGKAGCLMDAPSLLQLITSSWSGAGSSPTTSGRIKQPTPYTRMKQLFQNLYFDVILSFFVYVCTVFFEGHLQYARKERSLKRGSFLVVCCQNADSNSNSNSNNMYYDVILSKNDRMLSNYKFSFFWW